MLLALSEPIAPAASGLLRGRAGRQGGWEARRPGGQEAGRPGGWEAGPVSAHF